MFAFFRQESDRPHRGLGTSVCFRQPLPLKVPPAESHTQFQEKANCYATSWARNPSHVPTPHPIVFKREGTIGSSLKSRSNAKRDEDRQEYDRTAGGRKVETRAMTAASSPNLELSHQVGQKSETAPRRLIGSEYTDIPAENQLHARTITCMQLHLRAALTRTRCIGHLLKANHTHAITHAHNNREREGEGGGSESE